MHFFSKERNYLIPIKKLFNSGRLTKSVSDSRALTQVSALFSCLEILLEKFWGCGRIVGPFGPVGSSHVQSVRKKKSP